MSPANQNIEKRLYMSYENYKERIFEEYFLLIFLVKIFSLVLHLSFYYESDKHIKKKLC